MMRLSPQLENKSAFRRLLIFRGPLAERRPFMNRCKAGNGTGVGKDMHATPYVVLDRAETTGALTSANSVAAIPSNFFPISTTNHPLAWPLFSPGHARRLGAALAFSADASSLLCFCWTPEKTLVW